MTPKEKAGELMQKFQDDVIYDINPEMVKRAALIAVNEILFCYRKGTFINSEYHKGFWGEVKREIQES